MMHSLHRAIQNNPDNYSDGLVLWAVARSGQHGHSRKPSNFYASSFGCWWPRGVSHERIQRIKGLSERFRQLKHYQREIAPQWVADESTRTYYADNSEEITERATDGSGRTRRVTVKSPSGDLCF